MSEVEGPLVQRGHKGGIKLKWILRKYGMSV